MTEAEKVPTSSEKCADLLDRVLEMAVNGKLHSIGIVMVTAPGIYRVVAAGEDIDGLLAGATKMQSELFGIIDKAKKAEKPALTVIHRQ